MMESCSLHSAEMTACSSGRAGSIQSPTDSQESPITMQFGIQDKSSIIEKKKSLSINPESTNSKFNPASTHNSSCVVYASRSLSSCDRKAVSKTQANDIMTGQDPNNQCELTKHDTGWRRVVRHFTPSYATLDLIPSAIESNMHVWTVGFRLLWARASCLSYSIPSLTMASGYTGFLSSCLPSMSCFSP